MTTKPMSKAAATRLTILQKAFELIYAKGYQSTSIDDILGTTGVTKGAFYYHFKTKDEMGVAIIEELLRPAVEGGYLDPLYSAKNPLQAIHALIRRLLLQSPDLLVEYGCPAGNLIQEMAPWNEAFSEALTALAVQWQDAFEQCIRNGQALGQIRQDVQPRQVAQFVISGYWGIRTLGKLGNSRNNYLAYLRELKNYLASLS